MKIHKVAALSAILFALPFVGIATYLWLDARAHDYKGFIGTEASEMGDMIFLMGAPLTQIVLKFPTYAGRYLQKTNDWWAIPSIILLFVLLWIIWSQAIALLIRGLDYVAKTDRFWKRRERVSHHNWSDDA
jgi:hypothetical protein